MCNTDVPLSATVLDDEHLRQDDVDPSALRREALGAIVLRTYLRGERDGNWFTGEPIPANASEERVVK
jgi:hypothetical protein